jgi:nicotinamide-nucleotide adenylyltransferase
MTSSGWPVESNLSNLEDRLNEVSNPAYASVELFHASHPRWPLPFSASSSSTEPSSPVHIACFDSSFNPPTKAHFAISMSSFPPVRNDLSLPDFKVSDVATSSDSPYTARLLLLSARNVDKTLRPGDATLAQRVEMMCLQAQDMVDSSTVKGKGKEVDRNVAVAALNHPTFVGKSGILLKWLREVHLPRLIGERSAQDQDIRITFLIGSDTLTRLFMPKYYIASPATPYHPSTTPEQNMMRELDHLFDRNRCRIVSVHRGSSEGAREEEASFVRGSDECRRRLARGDIRFVEVGRDEMDMSSTKVREIVKAGGEGMESRLEMLCGERVRRYIVDKGLYRSE